MDMRLLTGGLTALGALAANLMGFIKAYNKTKETPEEEVFSWSLAAMTVLPTVAAGFMAGYQIDSVETVDYVVLFAAGFGGGAGTSLIISLSDVKKWFVTKL